MKASPRVIRLSDSPTTMRFVCSLDGVRLSEGKRSTTVTITRTGSFTDRRYGRFEITRAMLLSMVTNFDAHTYGQDIFIDVDHKPGNGAAARILALRVEGNRLRADVEFTDYGVEAVQQRGFRYLSAEFIDDYVDNEAGQSHGPTLLGAGLTVRPVIKRLDPVTLATEAGSDVPVFLHPDLIRSLSESLEQNTMKHVEKLRAKLRAKKLSERAIERIVAAYVEAAKTLGEDDAPHEALVNALDAGAIQLSEVPGDAPITIQLGAPSKADDTGAGGGADDGKTKPLSADDVRRMLSEDHTKRETDARTLSETRATRIKLFTDTIEAATGLSDDTRRELAEGAGDIITASMSDAHVKALADRQVALGNRIESSRQLSALGFSRAPAGSVHITIGTDNTVRKLAEDIRSHLRKTDAFGIGQIRAVADEGKLSPLAAKALAEFDRVNGPRLHAEAKMLAGGATDMSSTALPASYQREVLVEQLADLRILDLVSADVEPTDSPTHTIPYEERQTGSVYNDGLVYEGQAIPLAGVKQSNAYAYIEPMKIALELSDEVMHFSASNININWDAWSRNIASNARLARELLARRISNRMQRSADAFGAVAVVAEAVDAQVTVSNSLIKLANFPLVRPYQPRTLTGAAIGNPENPITIVRNGVACTEWDGTGNQSAGTYYRVESYNLAFIRFVDKDGNPVAAADSGTNTVSYSYATNLAKFDLDNGSVELPKHLNGLLRKIGGQKALMGADRFVLPDFGLSSSLLNDTISNAEQFVYTLTRDGTSTNAMGDLAVVKSIPQWGTNTPSDLGDERVILGVRGTLKYRIAKPFAIGERYPILNSQGRPLGKWGAYGTEFSSICVPEPLRQNFSSVIAYSATARAAAT